MRCAQASRQGCNVVRQIKRSRPLQNVQELLAMVPQPVVAVVMCYPITDESDALAKTGVFGGRVKAQGLSTVLICFPSLRCSPSLAALQLPPHQHSYWCACACRGRGAGGQGGGGGPPGILHEGERGAAQHSGICRARWTRGGREWRHMVKCQGFVTWLHWFLLGSCLVCSPGCSPRASQPATWAPTTPAHGLYTLTRPPPPPTPTPHQHHHHQHHHHHHHYNHHHHLHQKTPS